MEDIKMKSKSFLQSIIETKLNNKEYYTQEYTYIDNENLSDN